MGWIFDSCTDVYGSCIRQYINFALCFIVLILALYSTLRTYQTQKFNFQLLPLIINTISSLVLLVLYSQMEVYNIRIVLLIIEIYSYFILCYSFVFMVLKANLQDKIKQTKQKIIKVIFYIVSALVLIGIITTFSLSLSDVITCQEDQGFASIVVICLQFPLLVVTFVYSSKSKKLIMDLQSIFQTKKQKVHQTEHLIDGEDTYIQLKFLQLKYIRFAFIVSMVLHLIELSCYYIGNQQIICLGTTNKVQITNALELYILCIENLSQLFPHFIIPFIFWYIPAKIYKQNKDLFIKTDYDGLIFNSKQINNSSPSSKGLIRQESNLVPDYQNQSNIRQKLLHGAFSSNRKTS